MPTGSAQPGWKGLASLIFVVTRPRRPRFRRLSDAPPRGAAATWAPARPQRRARARMAPSPCGPGHSFSPTPIGVRHSPGATMRVISRQSPSAPVFLRRHVEPGSKMALEGLIFYRRSPCRCRPPRSRRGRQRRQVALLALAGLVRGRDPAIDRRPLSQLNSPGRRSQAIGAARVGTVASRLNLNWDNPPCRDAACSPRRSSRRCSRYRQRRPTWSGTGP